MMQNEHVDLVADCLNRIRSGFSAKAAPPGIIVGTPFVGPDFRPIEILVETDEESDDLVINDGGYIADYFFMHGSPLNQSSTLAERVVDVASTMGVELEDEELRVHDDGSNLYGAIVALLQTILAVPELWESPQRRVHPPPFRESVKEAVARLNLPMEEDFQIAGAIEEHCFDLGYMHAGKPLALQTLSATQRARAVELRRMIAWDVVDVRNADVHLRSVIVLDDGSPIRKSAIARDITGPLRRLDVDVIRWSDLRVDEFAPLRRLIDVPVA